MDWMLNVIWRLAIVMLFCVLLGVIGIGLTATTAVVYHIFDPSCLTIICV